MIRNVLALMGAVVILAGLVLWHFGFLSQRINEVSTQIERQTAVARAEARIRELERQADQIKEQARNLRVQARARELALERDEASSVKTREAIHRLAGAARDSGLSKPSAATDGDRVKTVSFAGQKLVGGKVYALLDTWQRSADGDDRKLRATRITIERLRSAADRLTAQRERLVTHVGEVRGKLEELAIQRDLAKVEAQLSELGANAGGNYAGELGKALDTIQKEIDESLAADEVLKAETVKDHDLSPDSVLEDAQLQTASASSLDRLWGGDKAKD